MISKTIIQTLYNANKKSCCADGSVQPSGMC